MQLQSSRPAAHFGRCCTVPPSRLSTRHRRVVVRALDGQALEQRLLQNPVFLKAANALSVFITKSPLNEAKKRWFVRLAGEYDRAATQQKIQSLIAEHPVRPVLCDPVRVPASHVCAQVGWYTLLLAPGTGTRQCRTVAGFGPGSALIASRATCAPAWQSTVLSGCSWYVAACRASTVQLLSLQAWKNLPIPGWAHCSTGMSY